MDSDTGTPSPATEPPPPARTKTTPFSGREDCWSAGATWTLIEAWGERYVDLNRGNLRQKHWQEVADTVNAGHAGEDGGGGGKSRRSDVQCKNRIDTLKKKYKIEKARVSDSGGSYNSPWPFFCRLDDLLGPTFSLAKRPATSPSPSPPLPLPPPPAGASYRNSSPPSWARHSPVPVGPRSSIMKRPAPAPSAADYSGSGRNFYAFAAAVAAMEESESESERSRPPWASMRRLSRGGRTNGKATPSPVPAPATEMLGQLAEAIESFGEIYQRVERAKQRQIAELEKQRMQFAEDLEYQRMRLFMETQVQIQKMKRAKRSSASPAGKPLFFCIVLPFML